MRPGVRVEAGLPARLRDLLDDAELLEQRERVVDGREAARDRLVHLRRGRVMLRLGQVLHDGAPARGQDHAAFAEQGLDVSDVHVG